MAMIDRVSEFAIQSCIGKERKVTRITFKRIRGKELWLN